MRSFEEILEIAAARKGGRDEVLKGLHPVKTQAELALIPSRDWLAQMAKGIFQAGISWQVVDAKWPGITEAFQGFDIGKVSMMSDDHIHDLLGDTRVIRSGPKLMAIRENAVFIRRVDEDEDGFSKKIAEWPVSDFVGLLEWLGKNGSRLGGTTGQYMLRFMGKESFILTKDVVARLQAEGVIDGSATSKKSLAAIQKAFDTWNIESGQSLNAISRVLAFSVDA